MKSSFSEKELIKDFCNILINNSNEDNLLIGIGDDAAVFRSHEFATQSTDALVENIHFDLSYTSFYNLGWKSIAVNQSDLAAMGSSSKYFLVTIGVPKSIERKNLKELYIGFKDILAFGGGQIIGGDLVRSNELFVSIAATGFCQVKNNKPLIMKRNCAKPGDVIAVTGFLGDSSGGLTLLKKRVKNFEYVKNAHFKPKPKIKESQIFSKMGIKSCIDISDGLFTDATRISEASKVSIIIDTDKIPVSQELKEAFPTNWKNQALNGGEDYQLLITGKNELITKIKNENDLNLTIIGNVENKSSELLTLLENKKPSSKFLSKGWDHFKNNDK
ncbi:MAG TPA: thiamine-phosphate kinase [Dehalococcoidia bacterium]|nr:thiamine-phosphate kinase [Dehalococcoidia bacterium]